MNQVGIYFAYWSKSWETDYHQYIDKIAGLGFDILEIATGNLPDMTADQCKELARHAKELDLTLTYCVGFAPTYDVSSPDRTVRERGIEYAKRTLERISLMGGKVFGGINYACWPCALSPDTDRAAHRSHSVESIREIVKTAEDYGITYCLEVVNRFEQFIINTVAEGKAFLREVNSSNLKLLLDTFHMNIEEDSFAQAIRDAGDDIGHFHIGETNRREPGTGRMPWDEIFGALKEVDYRGAIVMEPFVKTGGQVGNDVSLYRNLHQKSEAEMDEAARCAAEFVRSKLQ